MEQFTAGLDGWASDNPGVPATAPAGSLVLSFPLSAVPDPSVDSALVYTDSGLALSMFTGDYDAAGVNIVNFTFMAPTVAPLDLELRFFANGHEWSYNLSPSLGTTPYTVPLSYAGWTDGPSTDESDFLLDLEAVDWIGIFVQRNGLGAQEYGLDDFELDLQVPEPGELYLLATALSGLTFSFRTKIRGLLSLLRISA